MMKSLLLILLWAAYFSSHCAIGCIENYPTCGCKNFKSRDTEETKRRKRLYCRKIDVAELFANVDFPESEIFRLDLRGNYGLRELSREIFGHNSKTINILRGIMKLDLSENSIQKVAPGTFSLFTNLTWLDLSRNDIGLLSAEMFMGLSSLEVLNLSENIFPIIEGDVFASHENLRKLYVESKSLVCNCLMKDFITWMRGEKTKVKGACHLPLNLRQKSLEDISPDDMECGPNSTLDSLPYFEMIPAASQLTFDGDSLKMQCEGTNLPKSEVFWSFNGSPIDAREKSSFSVNVTSNLYKSIITGWLEIKNLTMDHAGTWNCTVTSEYGSATKMVHIFVMERTSGYCQQDVIENNKGTFAWPPTVSGMTRTVRCPERNFISSDRLSLASRNCIAGNWSSGEYADCPYADEVLEHVKNTLKESLKEKNVDSFISRLLKNIIGKPLRFPLAVQLIGELMEKVSTLTTVENRKKLATPLLNLASYVMEANNTVLKEAQRLSGACDKILQTLRNFALQMPSLPNFNEESKNIAIGGTMVSEKGQYNKEGDGMSCKLIKSEVSIEFACDKAKTNIHVIQPSIEFPKTFLDSCEDNAEGYRLYFIAFRDGSLFQSIQSSPSDENSTFLAPMIAANSIVLETGIKGCNTMNLSDPVNYYFETTSLGGHYAALWSPQGWTKSSNCSTYFHSRNISRVACKKLSTMTLIRDPNAESCNNDWFFADVAHPASLVGTGVLAVCLLVVILSFACCYRRMNMSSYHRHMIVNICAHLLVASITFALCIRRTDQRTICVACGIILHYTSLSVLLWITLSVRNIHRELTSLTRPPSLEPKPPRPMLRFYLIGWGIPVVICGITAAAKVQNYGGDRGREDKYCWLSWETSIFAFYSPAAFIAVVCIILLIRVLCAFSRHSAQLNTPRSPLARASWHGNVRMPKSDRYQAISTEDASYHDNLQTSIPSNAQRPVSSYPIAIMNGQSIKTQLCSAGLLFIFYLLTWVFAALSIAAPSAQTDVDYLSQTSSVDYLCYRELAFARTKTTVEDIFSYAFAIMAMVMGIFMVLQHFVCRKDVRSTLKNMLPCMKPPENCQNKDMRSSSPRLEESDKDEVETEQALEYLTSTNDKSLNKNRRGVYTTIKTDPTLETTLHSTDTGINGTANGRQYAHYHRSSLPKSCLGDSISYQPDFARCSIKEPGRPAKSITSLHSSYRVKHPEHMQNPMHHTHSHIMSSSGHRRNPHPHLRDPYDVGRRSGFEPDPRNYGLQDHHVPHQQHTKPVKLTNLHMAHHDSSMTEHSFDEMAHNNMHTIPVILQHHAQQKINNGALVDRYQKVRKALERKRAKQKRLNVLREYAQDPLTSNDEAPKDGKDGSVNESSPLIQSPEKTSSIQTNCMPQGALKFRPLLLSPSSKKQDGQRSKNGGPTKRVKRLDASGHPRPFRGEKRVKQNSRISHNSTLSEREQDTTSSEKSEEGANASTKMPANKATSVTKHSYNSYSNPAGAGKDNHGYLTLQQLQSANPFLFPSQTTAEVEKSPQVPESKLKNCNKSDNVISNASLNSSQLLPQRNETSV